MSQTCDTNFVIWKIFPKRFYFTTKTFVLNRTSLIKYWPLRDEYLICCYVILHRLMPTTVTIFTVDGMVHNMCVYAIQQCIYATIHGNGN